MLFVVLKEFCQRCRGYCHPPLAASAVLREQNIGGKFQFLFGATFHRQVELAAAFHPAVVDLDPGNAEVEGVVSNIDLFLV